MVPRIARTSVTQQHGTAPTSTSRNVKRKNRTQDAFALASAQDPDHIKIRQHRLGESELDAEEPRHKRRRMLDEETEDEDDAPPSNARRLQQQNVSKGERGPNGFAEEDEEEGSDGEGNHWQIGPGEEESGDDSVDSDEAFGDSDEERFEDFSFRGSKSAKSRSDGRGHTRQHVVQAEDDSDAESDDSLGSEAIDLATALDRYDEEAGEEQKQKPESEHKASTSAGRRRTLVGDLTVDLGEHEDGRKPSQHRAEPRVSLLEDDWAGFSDAHASGDDIGRGSASDDEDEASSSTDEAPDAPRRAKSLQDIATSFAKIDEGKAEDQTDLQMKPGALMEALHRLRQREGLKIPNLPKKAAAVRAPLEPRQQAKIDRTAAYTTVKDALTENWQDIVKSRRRAEHLHFPLADPNERHPKGENRMISATTTQPANELENTIEGILQESGLAQKQKKTRKTADEDDEDNEDDDTDEGGGLPAQKKLSKREERARLDELRKARNMIFREEQRAKRIKKIKSKAYRRIHRRERDRHDEMEHEMLREAGMLSADENDQEKHDRRRAEERMGGRHKNSRWAKSMKSTGRATWDDDARDGLNGMAKRDDELRARLRRPESDSGESIDELDSSDEETQFKLREKAENLAIDEPQEPQSRLASMKFMQQAEEKRREQNNEDLRRIRREFDGHDSDTESEQEVALGRRIFGPHPTDPRTEVPKVQRNELEEAEESGSEPDASVRTVNDKGEDNHASTAAASLEPRKLKSHAQLLKPSKVASQVPSISRVEGGSAVSQQATPELGEQDRPATSSSAAASTSIPSSSNDPPVVAVKPPLPETNGDTPSLGDDSNKQLDDIDADADAAVALHPGNINQADMVAQAFGHDELAIASFEKEKHAAEESEDDQFESTALPGWGTWTGAGLSQRAQDRNKSHSQKFIKKTQGGVSKNKRKDKNKANVILSEKKVRKNNKYLAGQLPHPFESKAQYERSLRLPLGKEWSTKESFQKNTQPRIMVKQGVIQPMRKGLQ